MKNIILLAFLVFTSFASLAQVSWKVDPSHGHFSFNLRYLMIGDYEGRFKNYEGKISSKSETDFTDAIFNIVIDINSVSAQVEGHEEMLKDKNFFDAEAYPAAFFRSTSMKPGSMKGTYNLEGELTIRGVTKKIKLQVTGAEKPIINPYFNSVNYGIKITGTIKRSDFGIGNYDLMDGGDLVLSDEVNLNCSIILIKSDRQIPMAHNKTVIDQKNLVKYVGQYNYEKNIILSISNEQGRLFAKTTTGYKKEIFPISNNKFIYEFYDVELEFVENSNGKVTKLIIPEGPGKVEAAKISEKPEAGKPTLTNKTATVEPNYKKLATESLMDKDFKNTIEYCIKGLKKEPDNLHIRLNLAHAYLFSGDTANAIKVYKENMDKKVWGVIPFPRVVQQDFIYFRSRGYSYEAMDKAFKELNLTPHTAYKAIQN